MFDPTAVVIDAFVDELRKGYISTYTNVEPDYPGIIDYVGHMALELIANSDEGEAASDYPALQRASDLVGQLADPNYMRKVSALFAETGMNEKLGYNSSAGLRAVYPKGRR